MQSLIHQPIFSCAIIGLFSNNLDFALGLGFISQLMYMSYIPVGGANIPDNHIAANLVCLLFSGTDFSVEIIGKFLPVIILVSIGFMLLTKLERKISTKYMIKIPYEEIVLKKMILYSLVFHAILFLPFIFLSYYIIALCKNLILEVSFYSGFKFFLFVLFFASGSLIMRYYKRGFAK